MARIATIFFVQSAMEKCWRSGAIVLVVALNFNRLLQMISELDAWNALANGPWKSSREQCWFHDFILYPSLCARLHAPLHVLDFGCGSGELIKVLISQGHHLVGFDPSIEMVRKATKTNPGVRIVSDLGLLGDTQFDVALLNLVLSCTADAHAACDLAASCASRIIITVPHPCFSLFSDLHTTTSRSWATHSEISDERELYFLEPQQNVTWDGSGLTTKNYHRSITSWLQLFRSSGLVLADVAELLPHTDGQCLIHLYERFSRIPAFMLFELNCKKAQGKL